MEKACSLVFFFFTFLSLQSDSVQAVGVPRSTRDAELACNVSGGAGCDGFVNDAAGLEDGAGRQ